MEFALAGDGDVLDYRLHGQARFGEGYICPYCGKRESQHADFA